MDVGVYKVNGPITVNGCYSFALDNVCFLVVRISETLDVVLLHGAHHPKVIHVYRSITLLSVTAGAVP